MVRKALRHGDFDLGFVPRHDVAVAADQADGDRRRGAGSLAISPACLEPLDGPLEDEALGNIVRVVFDESLFNEQGEVVFGKLEAMALPDVVEEPCGDGVGDVCDERAIFLVEDIFFLAREEKVGEGGADFVGNVGEVELPFVSGAARYDDLGKRGLERSVAERFAPSVAGLLVKRRCRQALQREVFCERDMAEHGEFLDLRFVSLRGRSHMWKSIFCSKLQICARVRHLAQGRGRIFFGTR